MFYVKILPTVPLLKAVRADVGRPALFSFHVYVWVSLNDPLCPRENLSEQ